MPALRIEGAFRTEGSVRIGGNKNAVLPMIAAALLTEEEVILRNVPDLVDVRSMLEIVSALGVRVRREKDVLILRAGTIRSGEIPKEFCSAVRTSLLFAGPLTVRTGSAALWPPGGDVIGRRRLDAHFYGLRKLGIRVDADETPYRFRKLRRSGDVEMFLDEASVTATEHILMTAAATPCVTTICNAAAEPHVEQLGELLMQMGAEICGLGTNTLVIRGKKKLRGGEITVDGDHVEAASFLSLAAATGGSIELTGKIVPRHYWMARRVFERFGIAFRLEPGRIVMPARKMRIKADFGNAIPVISDGPWPQFPSDMMSCMIVAATQARGSVLFFEKMFESRIYFTDRLIAMGANAIVCDPHRVVISGPAKLRGIEMASPDIRAGMALLIAGCCAKGESLLHRAEVIFRGYESLPEKIASLGGRITLLP